MLWYKHDSDASSDAKIKKLIFSHGAEGYAVYFHCLELIAGTTSRKKITFELEHDAEIIADNLKIKADKNLLAVDKVNNILQFIIDIGLFNEQNGRVFCFKMASRLDESTSKSIEAKKIIEKLNNIPKVSESFRLEEKRREEIRREEKRRDKDIPEKNEYIQKIFDYWNNLDIIKHTDITSHINKIKSRIKKTPTDDIKFAMSSYQEILAGERWFFSHKYTLSDFMTRGIEKFLPECDPLNNFIDKNKKDSYIDDVKSATESVIDDIKAGRI